MDNLKCEQFSLELVVCMLLGAFGVLYAVLMPPLVNPDEGPHFMRVHAIASGQIFPAVKDGVAYQMVPASLAAFEQQMRTIIGKPDGKYPYHRWFAESHAALPASEELVPVQTSAVRMSPLQYAPHVLGYLCGKVLFCASPAQYNWQARTMMSRLGSVAFAVAVYLFVMRRLTALRHAIAATIVLPMPVLLTAAVTSDTMLMAACVVYVSTIVRIYTTRQRDDMDTYALLASAFVVGTIKWVYAPLLLSLMVVQSRLSTREYRVLAAQVFCMALAGCALSATLFFPLEAVGAAASEQMRYLMHRPGEALRLPLRSLVVYRDYYLISLMMNFGSLDTSVPYIVILLLLWWYGAILVADCCFGSGFTPPFRAVVVTAASVVAAFYGVFLGIYCQWTSLTQGVGVDLVYGVQGRYFLPFLPFVALVLCYMRLSDRSMSCSVGKGAIASISVIHVVCILAIIGRYWIP